MLVQHAAAWYQCGYEHGHTTQLSITTRDDADASDFEQSSGSGFDTHDFQADGRFPEARLRHRPHDTQRCADDRAGTTAKRWLLAAVPLRGPSARARARNERGPRPSIK